MKTFLTLLLATLCAATSYGQTIKSLGFNSTNGQVIANTGTNALTFTNTPIILTADNGDKVSINGSVIRWENQDRVNLEEMSVQDALRVYDGGSNYLDISPIASVTRTNLGLPLNTLTNTSNVTTMRALSGSTNTNHPFSGSVSVIGTNNTNTLVFSNGILQEVQ
jgi:hypothetical protein